MASDSTHLRIDAVEDVLDDVLEWFSYRETIVFRWVSALFRSAAIRRLHGKYIVVARQSTFPSETTVAGRFLLDEWRLSIFFTAPHLPRRSASLRVAMNRLKDNVVDHVSPNDLLEADASIVDDLLDCVAVAVSDANRQEFDGVGDLFIHNTMHMLAEPTRRHRHRAAFLPGAVKTFGLLSDTLVTEALVILGRCCGVRSWQRGIAVVHPVTAASNASPRLSLDQIAAKVTQAASSLVVAVVVDSSLRPFDMDYDTYVDIMEYHHNFVTVVEMNKESSQSDSGSDARADEDDEPILTTADVLRWLTKRHETIVETSHDVKMGRVGCTLADLVAFQLNEDAAKPQGMQVDIDMAGVATLSNPLPPEWDWVPTTVRDLLTTDDTSFDPPSMRVLVSGTDELIEYVVGPSGELLWSPLHDYSFYMRESSPGVPDRFIQVPLSVTTVALVAPGVTLLHHRQQWRMHVVFGFPLPREEERNSRLRALCGWQSLT